MSLKTKVLIILTYVAFMIIAGAFYFGHKLSKNTFYIIAGGLTLILALYFFLPAILTKPKQPIVIRKELPMDDIERAIRKRLLKKGWVRGIVIGSGKKERVMTPGLQFTGCQRVYVHRGAYRALIEVYITDPDSPIRGLRIFDVPLSQSLKLIESGNFTVLDTDIWNYKPDYRYYPSEIPTSRFAQEVGEISQSFGLEPERAIEIAQTRQLGSITQYNRPLLLRQTKKKKQKAKRQPYQYEEYPEPEEYGGEEVAS